MEFEYDLITHRDDEGNWYMGGRNRINGLYYIYCFDANTQFIQLICLNDIIPNVDAFYYLYDKNQILVCATEIEGLAIAEENNENDRLTMDMFYLVDLEQKKIIKKFDIGIPLYNIHAYQHYLYAFTEDSNCIIEFDLENEKITKSINIQPFLQMLKKVDNTNIVYNLPGEPAAYYRDLLFDIVDNHLYLLSYYGLFKIDMESGACQQMIAKDKLEHKEGPWNAAYELSVIRDTEIYICANDVDDDFSQWVTLYTKDALD